MTSFRDSTEGPAWCCGLTLKIDLNVIPASQPPRHAHIHSIHCCVCTCFGVESKDTDALCDFPRRIRCTAMMDDMGILSALCDKDQESPGAHADDKHSFISLLWRTMTALQNVFC